MRAMMDNSRYLCVMIQTFKRYDLGDYEKITTCKSYSYRDLKYSHHQLQLQQVYLHLDLHREMGSVLITTKNITHKYSFACFYSKMRILILTTEDLCNAPIPRV